MGLAFWRSKKRTGNAAAKPATRTPLPLDDDSDQRADAADVLRTRARHRLIGAAALLLAVAIVVPMLLDPQPPPVPENIPIDIPSERTPFTPRLALPPVPAAEPEAPTEKSPVASPALNEETKAPAKTDAAKAASNADSAKPTPKAASRPATSGDAATSTTRRDATKTAEAEQALAALEAKSVDTSPAAAKGGKYAVQLAAPASEKAARDLVDRLKGGGFTAFIEKVDTRSGARYRVRVGPYASRDDAERARAKLKSSGMSGNLVSL